MWRDIERNRNEDKDRDRDREIKIYTHIKVFSHFYILQKQIYPLLNNGF